MRSYGDGTLSLGGVNMNDWISKLERAKALFDAGGLTTDEFEAEKARLIPRSAFPEPAENQEEQNLNGVFPQEDESETLEFVHKGFLGTRHKSWIFLGLGGAVMAFLFYVFWPANSDIAVKAPKSREVAKIPTKVVEKPPEPKIVSLDSTLKFSSPSECIAEGTLEKVYLKLDKAMENGGGSYTVKLDEYEEALPVQARVEKDSEEIESRSASVRLPLGTTWHGLKLSRIKADWYLPPETDSSYSRSINFLQTPREVQNVLNGLGFNAPLDPDYSELPDTYNSCGGAMYIQKIPGGSSLSCGWGC